MKSSSGATRRQRGLYPSELDRTERKKGRLIWIGGVDAFLDHRLRRLSDRSILQPAVTRNYSQTEGYTRVFEYKHITGQVCPTTSVSATKTWDDHLPAASEIK